MSRVFAYCRVLTAEQANQNQVQEIAAAGFAVSSKRIVVEMVAGSQAAKERPQFRGLLDRLEDGDVLVVTKLDRLGRSARDVRITVGRRQAAWPVVRGGGVGRPRNSKRG